jgi:hypothetical protein
MSIDITNNWNSWNTRYELSSDDDSAPLELIIAARETKMDVVISNHLIKTFSTCVAYTLPAILEFMENMEIELRVTPIIQRV